MRNNLRMSKKSCNFVRFLWFGSQINQIKLIDGLQINPIKLKNGELGELNSE